MAGALRLVLGDQLSRGLSSLKDIDPKKDHVLMVEVHDETTYVKHHKQKIVLILAAMRHFADELKHEGLSVTYVKLEDKENTGSFTGEIARTRYSPGSVTMIFSGFKALIARTISPVKDPVFPLSSSFT